MSERMSHAQCDILSALLIFLVAEYDDRVDIVDDKVLCFISVEHTLVHAVLTHPLLGGDTNAFTLGRRSATRLVIDDDVLKHSDGYQPLGDLFCFQLFHIDGIDRHTESLGNLGNRQALPGIIESRCLFHA